MDIPFSGERSQSFDYPSDNGYGRTQTQRKGFRGTEENAKTKLCMRWLAGDCRFGPRCNFAHGEHELRKMPPKPGRYSQDTKEREMQKEMTAMDVPPYGYSSTSFDDGYRNMPGGRSSMYADYYSAGGGGNLYAFGHGSGGYPGRMSAYRSSDVGFGSASPAMVQPSGPLHVAAAQPNTRDYYAGQGFPVVGPNGWMMYRDPKSGEPYYHNHQLSITQWNRPDEWPL